MQRSNYLRNLIHCQHSAAIRSCAPHVYKKFMPHSNAVEDDTLWHVLLTQRMMATVQRSSHNNVMTMWKALLWHNNILDDIRARLTGQACFSCWLYYLLGLADLSRFIFSWFFSIIIIFIRSWQTATNYKNKLIDHSINAFVQHYENEISLS